MNIGEKLHKAERITKVLFEIFKFQTAQYDIRQSDVVLTFRTQYNQAYTVVISENAMTIDFDDLVMIQAINLTKKIVRQKIAE